jgi:hypothetical protein
MTSFSHESNRVMKLSPTAHGYSCNFIYFREIRREAVNWIRLAQDRIYGHDFVNTLINILGSMVVRNFLTI